MSRYKAVRYIVWRSERYFVIPADKEIADLILDDHKMKDDVVAQCPTFETASNVAFAMNKTFDKGKS